MRWIKKIFLGKYAKSEYYWKLKYLLKDNFSIEYTTYGGGTIREYGIQLNGEFDVVTISDNFEFIGEKETISRIDNALKKLYEDLLNNK